MMMVMMMTATDMDPTLAPHTVGSISQQFLLFLYLGSKITKINALFIWYARYHAVEWPEGLLKDGLEK